MAAAGAGEVSGGRQLGWEAREQAVNVGQAGKSPAHLMALGQLLGYGDRVWDSSWQLISGQEGCGRCRASPCSCGTLCGRLPVDPHKGDLGGLWQRRWEELGP